MILIYKKLTMLNYSHCLERSLQSKIVIYGWQGTKKALAQSQIKARSKALFSTWTTHRVCSMTPESPYGKVINAKIKNLDRYSDLNGATVADVDLREVVEHGFTITRTNWKLFEAKILKLIVYFLKYFILMIKRERTKVIITN